MSLPDVKSNEYLKTVKSYYIASILQIMSLF